MNKADKQRRDWYTLSADTVKGWAVFLVVVGLAVGGVWGFRYLRHQYFEREVARVVGEAEELVETLRVEPGIATYRGEFDTARGSLEQAREQAASGALPEALKTAERSRTLLASIFGALRHQGAGGEARLIAVQGEVEYRRGERGSWQPARSRVELNAGDYVKTSGNGTAEIMTVDGSVYTVRSDTVILVGEARRVAGAASERTINLEFGWVDLSTSQSSSRIKTPSAEARVRRDSSALVTHDKDRELSRFAAYDGGMEVASSGGETKEIEALEQIEQRGAALSEPKPLPAAPAALDPSDNFETSLDESTQLVLAWSPVPGAQRYALQVARNRLFVENVIDVENRETTRATLGLQGEGSFMWRVAAYGEEGVKGPWSTPRRFRVTDGRDGGGAGGR